MSIETKPKTKFCWHCGRQLRGNFFREYQNPDDSHTYTVHAQCYEQLTTGCPPVRSEDELEDDYTKDDL
jgi:hypothetical protein